MGTVIHLRFGQPCFECREPVPTQRIRTLQRIAENEQRRWLKSDLVCVECAVKREIAEKAMLSGRPFS